MKLMLPTQQKLTQLSDIRHNCCADISLVRLVFVVVAQREDWTTSAALDVVKTKDFICLNVFRKKRQAGEISRD